MRIDSDSENNYIDEYTTVIAHPQTQCNALVVNTQKKHGREKRYEKQEKRQERDIKHPTTWGGGGAHNTA